MMRTTAVPRHLCDGASNLELSVAICTYNRPESLAETIETAVDLKIPQDLAWELLVVDNNSPGGVRAVCEQYRSQLPVRYLLEESVGLSHARNRALRECRGDLLVFTDDDVRLESDWLTAYLTAFRDNPKAAFFGGRILPLWTNGRPRWVRDEGMPLIGGVLVHYDLGMTTRSYERAELLPYGASFGIRRAIFRQAGTFRTDLGVSGSTPGRGEETEYLARIRDAGHAGVYVGAALCRHVVDQRRLRIGYLYRFGVQKGLAENRMNGANDNTIHQSSITYLVKGFLQLARGRGDRFRQCVINAGIQRGLRLRGNSIV